MHGKKKEKKVITSKKKERSSSEKSSSKIRKERRMGYHFGRSDSMEEWNHYRYEDEETDIFFRF